MKNVLIFIAGFLTGIVTLTVIGYAMNSSNSPEENNRNFTLFETPGNCISTNDFEIFQVLDDYHALAHEKDGKYDISTDLVVLFRNETPNSFYDEQRIKVPNGKCVRQIGVYKYETNSGSYKTVPVVCIMKQ